MTDTRSGNEDQDGTSLVLNPGFTSSMITKVHADLKQEIIITTEDRLKGYLEEYRQSLQKSRDWIAPLGILVTIGIVFPTTNFANNFLGMDAPTWRAVFFLSFIGCLGWLVITGFRAIMNALNPVSKDYVIDSLKRNSTMSTQQPDRGGVAEVPASVERLPSWLTGKKTE